MQNLQQLLDKGVDYSPRYEPSQNSDHLPMTLCAMAWLGASDEELARHQTRYLPLLQASDQSHFPGPIDGLVGKFEHYDAIRRLLKAEVETYGIENRLRHYLPNLIDSMAFEAFHPMIRLAYGLQAGHQGEIINGLAYWLSVHQAVDLSTSLPIDIDALLDQQAAHGPKVFQSNNFSKQLDELIDQGIYPRGRANLAACASASLTLFQATRNFFALHMVTATQAARVCGEYLPLDRLETSLTSALLASHMIVGSPARSDYLVADPGMDQDHIYKYAYACKCEYQFYQLNIYREEIHAYQSIGKLPAWIEY